MIIKVKKGWEISENQATSESRYLKRRAFLKNLGILGLGGVWYGCSGEPLKEKKLPEYKEAIQVHNYSEETLDLYPVEQNPVYTLDRSITKETIAATYNNFYEFTTNKANVWKRTGKFQPHPWTVEVSGLVQSPKTWDSDDLIRLFPLEERLYRLRCVEAWAMAVPWTGFPLHKLIEAAEPLGRAKYVRFVSFLRRDEAPGQQYGHYPWPYYEGLRMDEAMNELTFMATGIYGHPLPKQHGAPLRLVVPWKYGYKSIKSITRIEFLESQPPTFWNDLSPKRYGFLSNVNPDVSYQSWSQANETLIGEKKQVATQLYNGYGEFVADLYS